MASWVDLTRSCNTATSAEHKRVTRDLQGDLNKVEKSIVTLRGALKAMAAGGARFGHITPAILARRTESVDSASAVCVHPLSLQCARACVCVCERAHSFTRACHCPAPLPGLATTARSYECVRHPRQDPVRCRCSTCAHAVHVSVQ